MTLNLAVDRTETQDFAGAEPGTIRSISAVNGGSGWSKTGYTFSGWNTEADGTMYILAKVDDKVGFYKAEGTIPAGKAYLQVNAAGVKGFAFSFDGETGIESLTPALSEGEESIYDLSGRRVEKATKGIYIVNGKKIVK